MAYENMATVYNNTNKFTRKWGTLTNVVDPYITGYHFINWTYIPPVALLGARHLERRGDQVFIPQSTDEISSILASLCLSVTVPGRTVNAVEMQGLGGLKWRAVGNIDEGNDLSMRFLELQGLPIHRIFHSWTKGIRDNRSGTTFLQGLAESATTRTYSKSQYAGTVYYWTTRPNGYDVEFASCYAGVFPMKDPSDSFGHDVAANDKLEIDMDFSTDYAYQEDWVYENCQTFVSRNRDIAWNTTAANGTAATGAVVDYRIGINESPIN